MLGLYVSAYLVFQSTVALKYLICFICYSCCSQALICVFIVQTIKEFCFKYFSQVVLGFCVAQGWRVHLDAVQYMGGCTSWLVVCK